MPTFIDESGDTGPNPDPANCHFRLAAVWVPSHEAAESFREGIRQLRLTLRLKADYEFKFSRTNSQHERRRHFFEEAMKHEFQFVASSIDKRHSEWKSASSAAFHWASAVSIAVWLKDVYGAAKVTKELVVVDDNGDKKFLDTIKRKFRELGDGLVGKVKFRGSGPDELMQRADMVCGGVGAHLDGDSTWYEMIASRDRGIIRVS